MILDLLRNFLAGQTVHDRPIRLVIYFLFILAILLFILSLYLYARNSKLAASGHRAQGTVTETQVRDNSESLSATGGDREQKKDYYIIVSYEASDGSRRQLRSSVPFYSDLLKVGTLVGVVYDPADPTEAVIETELVRPWLSPLLALVFSLIVAGLAVVVIYFIGDADASYEKFKNRPHIEPSTRGHTNFDTQAKAQIVSAQLENENTILAIKVKVLNPPPFALPEYTVRFGIQINANWDPAILTRVVGREFDVELLSSDPMAIRYDFKDVIKLIKNKQDQK